MRFHENAQVLTADGTKVGNIDRIIVDPDQTDVTHLVVGQGDLLQEDSLVPASEIDRTTADDEVVLRSGVSVEGFEPFVEDRYAPLRVERPMFGPPGLALYPLPNAAADFVGWSPTRPAPTETTGAMPEGSALIEPGAPVITADDRRLGKVAEVVTSDDGTIDGVVATSGFLWFKRSWLIPSQWIEAMTESGVRLGISRDHARERAEENRIAADRRNSTPGP